MKEFLKKAVINLGGADILRLTNRVPRVLFWHGVDNITDPIVEAENFTIESFKDQISYLKKNYEIISMDEFHEKYIANKFNGKEIVLTFDDGYKNNLTVVAPFLKQYSIPFTVFVSTNNITTGKLFPTSTVRLMVFGSRVEHIEIPSLKYKRELKTKEQKKLIAKEISKIIKNAPNKDVNQICEELIANVSIDEFEDLVSKHSSIVPLNWDEVKELPNYGGTVGSHCMDHICCHENQNHDEVKKEIVVSKDIIEQQLGTPCHYFAYPNGDFTSYSNDCVRTAGYKLGFSTKRIKIRPGLEDSSSIPRIGVPQNINTFKIFINQYPK